MQSPMLKSHCVCVPPHYKWSDVNFKAFWIAKDQTLAEVIWPGIKPRRKTKLMKSPV